MLATEKKQQVRRIAERLYSATPDWVTFYREILGLHGVVRRTFSTRETLTEFEQTEVYQEIQHLLTKLRKRRLGTPDPDEPTQVITVRLPKSLHDALRVEAHEHRTTMNKLCISKLLQFIDDEMVPAEP